MENPGDMATEPEQSEPRQRRSVNVLIDHETLAAILQLPRGIHLHSIAVNFECDALCLKLEGDGLPERYTMAFSGDLTETIFPMPNPEITNRAYAWHLAFLAMLYNRKDM